MKSFATILLVVAVLAVALYIAMQMAAGTID